MNAMAIIENDMVALPPATSLSLELPANLSFDGWKHIGRELAARDKVLNWWIGDWWAFGEHRYGERARMAAEGVFGIGFGAIANAASVCRAVETSRRREALPWSHHVEVAVIARQSPDTADMILDRAEREHMTVAQVRAAVRAQQVANDPGEPSDQNSERHRPQTLTPPEKETVEAWIAVTEMADALEEFRPLTKREGRLRDLARNGLADKWDGIVIPDEFEVVFTEQGRVACENWYNARRTTIDKWLTVSGKLVLLKRRAAYIEYQRTRKRPPIVGTITVAPVVDRTALRVAAMAAEFIRKDWRVHQHPTLSGIWVRGALRETSEELIAFAETKGFDRRQANLQIAAEQGEN